MTIGAQAESQGHDATPPGEPTSVYRYYDRVGILIYVGITRQGMGRNLQHNGRAEWWPHVSSQEVEHYPTRAEAAAREKALIKHYRPPFNKQHNVDFESLRAAYRTTAAVPWAHASHIELYQRLGKMLPLEVVSFDGPQLVFQTRREHASLTQNIVTKKGGSPLCGRGGMGTVRAIRADGTRAYLICKVKPACPRDIDGGIARIALQPTKPPHVRLDRIEIVQWASN